MEKLRVMLIDHRPDRSSEIAEGLERSGCQVIARTAGGPDLAREVAGVRPDVIIIDLESPDRDTLEGMQRLSDALPRPIVMFVDETDRDAIRTAVRAGVAAYVVKGASAERVRPVLDVAIARFEEHQALKDELHQVKSTLEERKITERAKGLLMKRRGMTEQEAYAALRKLAMDQNLKLSAVARRVLDMADVL